METCAKFIRGPRVEEKGCSCVTVFSLLLWRDGESRCELLKTILPPTRHSFPVFIFLHRNAHPELIYNIYIYITKTIYIHLIYVYAYKLYKFVGHSVR